MPEAREIIVCPACELRQFMTQSGDCRRCHSVLKPPPEVQKPVSPPITPQVLVRARQATHKLGATDYYPATLELNSQPLPHKMLSDDMCPDDIKQVPWRDHAAFCRASAFVFLLLRSARGWSQLDVADRLGCPRTYISKLDNAHLLPTSGNIPRLAAAYGCSASFLTDAIATVYKIQSGRIALEDEDLRAEAFRAHNLSKVTAGV